MHLMLKDFGFVFGMPIQNLGVVLGLVVLLGKSFPAEYGVYK